MYLLLSSCAYQQQGWAQISLNDALNCTRAAAMIPEPEVTLMFTGPPMVPWGSVTYTSAPAESLAITAIATDSGTPGDFVTNDTTLTAGQWNQLWYALPSDFNGSAATLGIQLYTAKPGVSSDVYVDALYW